MSEQTSWREVSGTKIANATMRQPKPKKEIMYLDKMSEYTLWLEAFSRALPMPGGLVQAASHGTWTMRSYKKQYNLGLRATAGAWQYESGLRPSSEARSNCGEANFNTSEPAALFCRTEISTCSSITISIKPATPCFVLSPPDKKSDYRSRSQEQYIDRLTLQTSHQELCSQPDADSRTGKRIGHLSTRTLGASGKTYIPNFTETSAQYSSGWRK
ncbi:hypothetical protein DFH06DRAFT_1125409 [Mycena polygramma]|nr:hypothetical protein DFH06DRAFT_1125409 [Mycena polygramma]